MILKKKAFLSAIAIAAAVFCNTSLLAFADETNDDYLHTDGRKILDQSNNEVRLTGAAWFGYETPEATFHGLWSTDFRDTVNQIADLGFNIVRVPLSVATVNKWRQGEATEPKAVSDYYNPLLAGKSGEEVLDTIINYCKEKGVKIMFDMHRVYTGDQSNVWHDRGFTTDDYEQSWVYLAKKYKNDDTVIACDLFNEPHGKAYRKETCAKWDESEDEDNWKYEAEKVGNMILDENPNLLLMVEGVETYPKEGHAYGDAGEHCYNGGWWGGNLMGVKDHPIDLGDAERNKKIVYAPHDYGPGVSNQSWFEKDFNTDTLKQDIWGPSWFYIYENNIAPILIGEWGGRLDGGKNQKWLESMADLIEKNNLNHTFWCVNPNSGDTGGILDYDFKTVDQAKYAVVKPTLWQTSNGKFIGLDHKINLGAKGTHVAASQDIDVPDNTIPDEPIPEVPPIVTGDVNDDDEVNISDYTLLRRYINADGEGIEINSKNADLNRDGEINFLDLLALKSLI